MNLVVTMAYGILLELSSNIMNQSHTPSMTAHAMTFSICPSSIFDYQCLNQVPLLRSNNYSELTFIGFDKISWF